MLQLVDVNEEREFRPGDIVKHFKSEENTPEENAKLKHYYRIIGTGMETGTGNIYMIYQALYGNYQIFLRPYDMFMSEVDHRRYPEIKQKYRIEKV